MACFRPLKGWRSRTVNEKTGKRSITFSRSNGLVDLPVELPCGQCIGCRLERSRQWAMRCVHEAALHEDNIFITLTYDNDHVRDSLDYVDFQLFMKRLRVHTERHTDRDPRVRFYMCGEYGEQFGRPHFHAIMFNYDLADKRLWKMERDNPLHVSQTLTDLWGKGHTSIGSVTFQSAAYVARYIMKKVTGDAADDHYNFIDEGTGEFIERKPEFTKMSLRPGIGGDWFDKYQSDVFPDDFVVLNGKKVTPPRFYTSRYELLYPDEVAQIKRDRKKRSKKRAHDSTPERLKVREQVLQSRISRLKRTIE
ncbi:replication initiator protein [robinz microvirus RP_160]|nr:replication initiator protein [robinz microvirus RP_160]